MQPLAGISVVDFSTLLPGPLASLLLAEAGAEVTKIERPGVGDEMRGYPPPFGPDSAIFALLNRGKKSIAIDLKAAGAVAKLRPLLAAADVLIEQFRPGVMARLGLGYEALRELNPRLVYCSITGFGQDGPRAQFAGHDLNYLALAGLLGLSRGSDGAPTLPIAPIADIAGGTYPAVMNILLALFARQRTGAGCHLDVAMTDSVLTLAYWALAKGFATGAWPRPGNEFITGGLPRYQIYATSDGGYLAAAPLEDRFWTTFCRLIGLDERWRDDTADPAGTRAAVAAIIARETTRHWRDRFDGEDVCCCVVASLEDAVQDPHFRARGLFERTVSAGGAAIPALPLPLAPQFATPAPDLGYPALGADNASLPER